MPLLLRRLAPRHPAPTHLTRRGTHLAARGGGIRLGVSEDEEEGAEGVEGLGSLLEDETKRGERGEQPIGVELGERMDEAAEGQPLGGREPLA